MVLGFRLLTLQEAQDATSLIRKCEGQGACSDHHVVKSIKFHLANVIGAYRNQKLIGVSTAQILPDGTGTIVHLSVDDAFRDHGIGSKLVERQIEFFQTKKCSNVFVCSWDRGQDGSESIFVKTGFKQVEKVENFYREALKKTGNCCLACGKDCHCSAIIFQKYFD